MPFTIVVVVFIAALFFTTVKVLNEYERGVMFTLGRFTGIKGPGLVLVAPMVQQMRKVDLRVIVLGDLHECEFIYAAAYKHVRSI